MLNSNGMCWTVAFGFAEGANAGGLSTTEIVRAGGGGAGA